jgi:cell division protein FtsL
MKNSTAFKIFICIFVAALTVYLYIDRQNDLTQLRLTIPMLAKEVKQIQEENIRLQYEIDQFESPIHLLEIARKPEFGHLKYPHLDQVIILEGHAP